MAKKKKIVKIYEEEITIDGYGPFLKVCRLVIDEDGAFFEIKYPEFVVDDGEFKAVGVDTVVHQKLEDAEREWNSKIEEFKSAKYSYIKVIMYKVEDWHDGNDGSGAGLMFNWGVFREVETPEGDKWFVEKDGSSRNKINRHYHNFRKWNRLEWSQASEDFMMKISNNMRILTEQLKAFLVDGDMAKVTGGNMLDGPSN